jgi:hypothetical protein
MSVALRSVRSTGLSVLTSERVDAAGYHCAECNESPDDHGMLLQYATQIGARVRTHDGLFCSKDCHDRWHGLQPKD